MEFFDGWKTLNARFDEGDLTALTQLVGYKLYVIFDEHRFPDSLPISDRELMSRTGIKSGRTIVEARRRLKNAGLIDYETSAGKSTRYRWASKQLVSTKEAVSKQLVSTKEAVGASSNIRARDPYTPNLNPKEEGARTHAEIWEVFTDEMQRPATASERYDLVELVEEHGYEKVADALKRTRRIRHYSTYQDFLDVLNGIQPTRSKKGGEKRGTVNEMRYAEPEDSGIDLTAY